MEPRKPVRLRADRLIGLIGSVALLVSVGCAGDRFGQPNDPQAWRAALQSPLTSDEAASLSQGIELHEVLPMALMRNPGVEAQRRRWLAAIHVEPQATSLKDPMLQFGYQFDSVETRVGPQRWNLGLSQQIPWWRKLWARGRRAGTLADIARLRFEAAARDLIVDVKDAYYELYYLDQAIPITRAIEDLLKNEGLLAYSEMSTGRTQLNEAFRAESQAAQLAYDRILLEEQRAVQVERLRSLLNLPPGTAIGPVRAAPVYEVSDNLPAIYERAELYAQVLQIRGLEIEKARYDAYSAELARIPDVTVGVNFIQTGGSRASGAMKPKDSGKNPFIGMLSMNLPIWEQRNRALIREKEAMEEAMELQAMEEANNTRQAVAQAYFQVSLTDRLAQLYARTLLPQAEAVMSQVELDFRGDQVAFSSVLETTMAYHNFLLSYQRAVADHGQAIGRLEKVIGTTAEPRDALPMQPDVAEGVKQ